MTYDLVREHTMIPEGKFYDNLWIADQVRHVKGSVVECGVWKGGMIAALYTRMGTHRTYHLFDSFEGLPPAQEIDGEAALRYQADHSSPTYYNNCKADPDDVVEIMRKVGCHDYEMHCGWLEKTLGYTRGLDPIALLRIDVDWYAATRLCIERLYHLVVDGGAVIFDDYDAYDGCRKAVDEFFEPEYPQLRGQAYYMIKRSLTSHAVDFQEAGIGVLPDA